MSDSKFPDNMINIPPIFNFSPIFNLSPILFYFFFFFRSLTFDQVDPFSSLHKIWKDKTILMLCLTVFLSYLPEAGQYSCFFVYLRLVMHFSKEAVAMFIAAVGILSVIAQTGLLTCLMKTLGAKHTIMVGLLFEMLQLMWYGFGSQTWMMWAAGILAAISR